MQLLHFGRGHDRVDHVVAHHSRFGLAANLDDAIEIAAFDSRRFPMWFDFGDRIERDLPAKALDKCGPDPVERSAFARFEAKIDRNLVVSFPKRCQPLATEVSVESAGDLRIRHSREVGPVLVEVHFELKSWDAPFVINVPSSRLRPNHLLDLF